MSLVTARNKSPDLVTFKILVDDTAVSTALQIISVTVTKEVNRISAAQVVMFDGDSTTQEFAVSNENVFKPGNTIVIRAGYHFEEEVIFKGVIVEHGITTRQNGASKLVIKCRDEAVKMTQGRKDTIYRDSTDGEIISEIADAYRLKADVAETTTTHAEMVQYRSTDWDFVVTRAEKNGLQVLVDDGTLSAFRPVIAQDPKIELTYGIDILDMELNIDARNQVQSVVSSAWDCSEQTPVEEEGISQPFREPGNIGSSELASRIAPDETTLKHSGTVSDEELREWGSSKITKCQLSKISGRLKIQGLSVVGPGDTISLMGAGDRFNGNHFVSGVRHSIASGIWETHFQLGLASQWFFESATISQPRASGLLPAISGLQIGIVSQLQDDPDGESRIRVQIPVIDANDEGVWARLACMDAGNGRSAFFLPEIGDEVIVSFVNNDPRYPVVLGMLHSSAKPPPVTASDENHIKGIVTRSDMRIMFDDNLKKMTLSTPAGKTIEIDEDAGHLQLADEHGNSFSMTADGISVSSAGKIEIAAKQDLSLEGLNLTSQANAQLSLAGELATEVKSSGAMTVQGATIKIN